MRRARPPRHTARVSILVCSSPYSTCVGGTQFAADVSAPSSYWSSTNSSTFSSALQYIGEAVWNQSGTQSGGSGLWSSGGGASIYFAKPEWQLSTGVPSDGFRDLPDVSLAASCAHDPYLIYSSDGNTGSTLEGVGGTSAAAPSMAAIAALVAQKQKGRVGNFNPVSMASPACRQTAARPCFIQLPAATTPFQVRPGSAPAQVILSITRQRD